MSSSIRPAYRSPLGKCASSTGQVERALWAKINAATIPNFTPPLLMLDAFDVATFDTDLAALKTAYLTWTTENQELTLELQRRDDVQDLARNMLCINANYFFNFIYNTFRFS